MFIRWGNSCSKKNLVINVVEQGGYCPHSLLNVYIIIESLWYRGCLGDHLINKLCFADDLYLIALSSTGMQQFLDTCDA